ncbi:MAG TPA: isoprenylcysteine carboxylmethyltransferase family protein [Bacteroidetes bacterium]|nr:isoprenylcysteine carboxylmethyltransferase family protein [Bacteroidota bacterium]
MRGLMKLADLMFRIRGFTPIPLVIIALIWAQIRPAYMVIGLALVFSGELLRLDSIRHAGGSTRTRNVGAPALITSGPFARVRNPLYLANMLIYAGFALAAGALFPYLPIIAVLYFAFQYGMIISLEERTLRRIFNQQYSDYCQRVPRLIPKLTRTSGSGAPNLSIREALVQEKKTLMGLTNVWLLLAVRFIFF